MRDRFLAVLLTLVVFATGFVAGLWAERHRPFPPPPGAFMGEFGARWGPRPTPSINRAQLAEQIRQLQPQMDAFKERLQQIYADFDRDIDQVLTPAQKARYDAGFKSHRLPGPQETAPDAPPLSDEQIDQLLQRPFRTMAYFIVIPMTLERMTNELKLDDTQKGKVKDLLRVRREKFVELVDDSAPPSLMLSRLAPVAQRLGSQPKPAGAPAR
jgi:Spy/CpxP family protein refolding chaperone